MNSLLIHPLSFLLAILWYEPTRDGEQRILPFALVTTVDLLTLLIFLFQRQIGHWHNILTSDIKQGHFRAGSIDDTFVCQGNEQVRHPNFGARPDIPRSKIRQIQEELVYDIDAVIHSGVDTIGSNHRSIAGQFDRSAAGGRGFGQRFDNGETSRRFAGAEVAMRGPSNVGWGTRMVQPVSEDQEIEQLQPTSESQEIEEVRTDLHLDQQERRQSGYFIDVGIEDVNSDSGSGIIYPPCPVGTPNTIYRDIHPALRPTFDNTSQPVSPDGSQTPKQAPSFTGTSVLELNKI